MGVTLRPKCKDDDHFLREVYASTREEELAVLPWTSGQKEQFLDMQFSLQTRYYEQLYPEMDYRIILDNGAPAGRFIVDRTKDEIRLIDVAVMPAHRGAGIGQALLRGLLREADALGKPVVLHVEHLNRARHLYERLGFRPAGEAGIYLRMEWHPAGVSGHIRG